MMSTAARSFGIWSFFLICLHVAGCGDEPEHDGPRLSQQIERREPADPDGPTGGNAAGAERGLHATIDIGKQMVSGSFGGVRFIAERTGKSTARAVFEVRDDLTVTTIIEGPEDGRIELGGLTIDGYGSLTEPEQRALDELLASDLWRALALIPLDLACRPEAPDLEPVVGAALLMPMQMLLKYRFPDLEAELHRLARRSECGHFRGVLSEPDPAKVPSPNVVALTFEQPIPMALGYFPFDGKGGPATTAGRSDR